MPSDSSDSAESSESRAARPAKPAAKPASERASEPSPETAPTTARLAAGARDGDEQQFAELYARVAPALFAWAHLRIRPSMQLHVEPQDLVQEVWLRSVSAFPRFDPETRSFRAWIFTIAKNVLLEGFRRLRRSPFIDPGGGPTTRLFALANCPDDVTSLSRRLSRDDAVTAFLQRVGQLSADDRRLLIHCGIEDLTCAEAATRLDLGEDAVIKRWQRLRRRLREQPWARDLLA